MVIREIKGKGSICILSVFFLLKKEKSNNFLPKKSLYIVNTIKNQKEKKKESGEYISDPKTYSQSRSLIFRSLR